MIKDFDAFFEVMAVSNFAFSAEPIRDIFGKFTSKFVQKLDSIRNSLDNLNLIYRPEVFQPMDRLLQNQKKDLFDLVEDTTGKLNQVIKDNKNISIYFQSVFFSIGIFCLFFLFLVGCEHYHGKDFNANYYLFFFNFIVIYSVAVFVLSFWRRFYINSINHIISVGWIAIILFIITVFCLLIYSKIVHGFTYYIHSEINTILAVLVSCSSFLFYFARITFHHRRTKRSINIWLNELTIKQKGLDDLYAGIIRVGLAQNEPDNH
jgi:hypothetical protein